MTKLPVVNGRQCIRALQKGGFVIERQKGSHVTLIRDEPYARVTVPNHKKALRPGTLRQIIRDAGLTVQEFVELL
ncbi:MAG: type II toxin-antitoxin system HicA family toxin [Chitinophagaceae bacterium]|nr:type II toxin-antitoxin system HicA family toxin [Anaerolineae bacterium]